ncbi:hypothetical protein, partial [Paraburkholderia madseniana]|uniref:hypothetical protein n=1 Tax=Paraburkholderia madseniana TaxID=2599607 RepID=UPI001A7E7F4C
PASLSVLIAFIGCSSINHLTEDPLQDPDVPPLYMHSRTWVAVCCALGLVSTRFGRSTRRNINGSFQGTTALRLVTLAGE